MMALGPAGVTRPKSRGQLHSPVLPTPPGRPAHRVRETSWLVWFRRVSVRGALCWQGPE
jgi:hypothetical protein